LKCPQHGGDEKNGVLRTFGFKELFKLLFSKGLICIFSNLTVNNRGIMMKLFLSCFAVDFMFGILMAFSVEDRLGMADENYIMRVKLRGEFG
jgi:hypothetical protein